MINKIISRGAIKLLFGFWCYCYCLMKMVALLLLLLLLLPPKLQRRGLVFKGKMVTVERV